MNSFIAALPMYDWPEVRAETDAAWLEIRDALRASGVDAPQSLTRRNIDMPPVPGGIADASGKLLAPDPASLSPDELDLPVLWRHPRLLLAQTCWGPMEQGLASQVLVVAQPSYDGFEGGRGTFYSSAILVRRDFGNRPAVAVAPPSDGRAMLPFAVMRNARLAYNATDSMSGMIGLARDLDVSGESLAIFAESIETGSHRASIRLVAEGSADICAVDCRTWSLAKDYERCAGDLLVAGWTASRPGLPLITSRHTPDSAVAALKAALAGSAKRY